MRYSISNLSWGNTPLHDVIPKLASAGLHGVEIAPTAIWPCLDNLSQKEILEFKRYLEGNGLVVSGIQSLLYGHPELQLFDQNCWPDLKRQLENVIRIGGLLETQVAVFGSPKNRLKGNLDFNEAEELAETFLKQLIPCLKENDIVLTLEPNAPDYGADYLINYEEVLKLSQRINSASIRPQIDTGCLWMVGSSPEAAYSLLEPHHIHLSVPKLEGVPGVYEFGKFLRQLRSTSYDRWLVIEMLAMGSNPLYQMMDSISWLINCNEICEND